MSTREHDAYPMLPMKGVALHMQCTATDIAVATLEGSGDQ
jgi:hypothetical protein